jgi:macrolide transport system ATP-binding/permease protein
MAEGTRGSSGRGWQRLGSKLVAVELATAVVLLVGAGLLGKSLYQVLHVHLGFDADHVVTVQITPPRSYTQGDKTIAFERELLSRVENLPGVKAVGLSGALPTQSWDQATWIRVVGKPIQGKHNEVPQRSVNSTYFSTLSAKLARGRYFTSAEDVTTTQAAIINQSFAKRYFPGEDPIGKQLTYELGAQAPMEIVGVVEDVKEGQIDSANRSVLYVPFVLYAGGACNVIVRASGDQNAALAGLTATIRQIEPNTVMRYAATLMDRINNTQSAYLRRSSAVLIGGFAGLALLLSVVGLYGVVAYSVSQRTREIGVRIALGADRGSVCQLVLKEALTLTVIGMTIGLGCSLGAATFLRSLLFGVGTWDIETFCAVAVVLGVSATLASFIPARHAASVNPVEALRAE